MLNQQMMEEVAEINDFESFLKEANVLKYKKNLLKQEVEDSGTNLPYHVLYDILVKFPASYLYENSRLVCKWWKEVISTSDFIAENALQAKSQALIQQSSTSPKSQYFKVYKVVHVYANLFGFEIFALGCSDNSWRRVSGPWKDPWERPFDLKFRWSDPVLVSGRFLHWYVNSHQYIISMDVWFRKHSISAETISYTTNYDYLLSVKYNNAVPNLDNLIPLGSLRDGEVLAFAHKHSDAFYVYETRRREMKKLKTPTKDAKPFISPHRNTLLHWNTPNGS
ncbi:hypothetical protein Acr_02g0005480 [Actinidia rufa]|uniref:F-box domain-containing protein n=1 Tax=Actinidia rufa TaxID=165716 RepID=A0A7J0E788_9ERIC|nr:hypothetical protein Acr_02g0005480 [Actinidia rufa]